MYVSANPYIQGHTYLCFSIFIYGCKYTIIIEDSMIYNVCYSDKWIYTLLFI